jgi:GT2 family glycosyltransferase
MITGSLVLYNNEASQYSKAIKSFLNGCDGILTIIDNSPSPLRNKLFFHNRIKYIHSKINLGFGVAHNKAIAESKKFSNFHLIMNPDIVFGKDVIPHLVDLMKNHKQIGALMPKINFPDGSSQSLCKMFPTPIDLIFRRFIPISLIRNYINAHYEIHDLPQNEIVDVPVISGCFLMVRLNLFKNIGGFDSQYFMYLEDVDLVRRIGMESRVVYDPFVSVTHSYAKGSYYNKKLLSYHIKSAIKYFNKWGWLFDRYRRKRNSEMIRFIKNKTNKY